MPRYRVTTRNEEMTIPAARFERDGAGTRFYDGNDQPIAAFSDGTVSSVIDLALISDEPEGGEE